MKIEEYMIQQYYPNIVDATEKWKHFSFCSKYVKYMSKINSS